MRIVEIRETAVPLDGGVANSMVSFDGHTVSLIAVVSDAWRDGRRLIGVAFNSIGRYAQSGIVHDRMIPRVLEAEPDSLCAETTGLIDPAKVLGAAMQDEKPGGHGDRAAAAAAIELACWDLLAKSRDEPACVTIARAHGRIPDADGVEVYAAGGYYQPGDTLGRLRAELSGYRDAGYAAVKIKVGGLPLADDIVRLETAIEVMGAGSAVAADANGRLGLDEALEYAHALDRYGLRWFEEAGDPLDFDLNRRLGETYAGPLATGENLFSVQDVKNLLLFGGVRADRDVLQMDAGLSYGLTEYVRMLALMDEHGVDRRSAFPHGGHLINLHIVAGLGLGGCEAYQRVFQPFGGFSEGCRLVEGRVRPSDDPGFGLEAKTELADQITRLIG